MDISYFFHPIRRIRGLRNYLRIFGLRGLSYAFFTLFSKHKPYYPVAPKWSPYPVYLRLNSSDIRVFLQVFVDREYQVVTKLASPLNVIIDAGANIGLTSVFLANLYPRSRILAIEPDGGNMEMLRLNTAPYPNIECVQGALWDQDQRLSIKIHDTEDWAFQVTDTAVPGETAIEGYRLDTLMQRHSISRISLLKMDIEGTEYEVLSACDPWIDKTDNIIIELHEAIRPGCTQLFMDRTKAFKLIATTTELTLISRPWGTTGPSA